MNKYLSSTAVFDSTKVYRYRLDRKLSDSPKRVVFVLLNPSTATDKKDDPTIRRCVGFAKRLRAGQLTIVNIFALRSTDPKSLYSHINAIGQHNNYHIIEACREANIVIAAWGNHGLLNNRGAEVTRILRKDGVSLFCLGTTKSCQPKHPLYLAANTRLYFF